MKRALWFLVLFGVFGFLVPEADGASLAQRFHDGDFAFQKRADEKRARAALEIYRELRAALPRDPDAAWRVAMGCYFVGLRLTPGKEEKARLFAEGREAGLAALRVAPGCAACHFWTAINMALYGETVGVMKMLFSLSEIREHLAATLRLDASYAHGGAQRLLGLIAQKLPGILGGSREQAQAFFLRAIQDSPDEPLNYLFMAQVLGEKENAREEAVRWARQGLAVPLLAPDRLESIEAQAALRKFLEKEAGLGTTARATGTPVSLAN